MYKQYEAAMVEVEVLRASLSDALRMTISLFPQPVKLD
jgi:hypothetical protein